MKVSQANGSSFQIPMFDPVVNRHIYKPSSVVATLLEEINAKEIYAPLFKGATDLTFLDIGANIGLVSIYAYDSCSRIVAVEPAPETFTVMKAMTFALTKIEQVHAALAPVDGPCEFFLNDVNTTASSSVNTYGEMIEVPGLTLSSILSIYQLEHVDVAKVDVEGAEWASLNREQLEKAASVIDCWWLEVHNIPRVSWELIQSTISEMLHELGYVNQQIDGMRLAARK